jgi:hypothetical protein
MEERMAKLFKTFKKMPIELIKAELEAWDRDQGRVMKRAEKEISIAKKNNTSGHLSYGTRVSFADIGGSNFENPNTQKTMDPQSLDCRTKSKQPTTLQVPIQGYENVHQRH